MSKSARLFGKDRMKNLLFRRLGRTAGVMLAAVSIIGFAMLPGIAAAQTQQQRPMAAPLVLPGNQGNIGGSTLELPTSPSTQLSPQLAPPPPPAEQELSIPAPQLRQQPGYEQVTVTVTDPRGAY